MKSKFEKEGKRKSLKTNVAFRFHMKLNHPTCKQQKFDDNKHGCKEIKLPIICC